MLFLFLAVLLTLGKPLNLFMDHKGNKRLPSDASHISFNFQDLNFSPFLPPLLLILIILIHVLNIVILSKSLL